MESVPLLCQHSFYVSPKTCFLSSLHTGIKLVCLSMLLCTIFVIDSILAFLIAGIFVFLLVVLNGLALRTLFRFTKPIIPLVVLACIVYFVPVLAGYKISPDHALSYLLVVGRLVLIISFSLLLLSSTTPLEFFQASSQACGFLERIGFSGFKVSLVLMLSFNFMVILKQEMDRLKICFVLRCPCYRRSWKRMLHNASILVASFIQNVFRRADRIAMILDTRCFGQNRWSMVRAKALERRDFCAVVFTFLFSVFLIYVNRTGLP